MDFSFTDEQQMLLDTTHRFITERYGFEYRNDVRQSAAGWSRDTWRQLAEIGLLSANIPESDGGIGAGVTGTMLIANAIGEGLLLEPFLSSAVVATHAIAALASPSQREQWFSTLASGETIAVCAHEESLMKDDMAIQTSADAQANGWCIQGRKSIVYHAGIANLLLVSARVDDTVGLFAVPADASGLSLQPCVTVDEQRAANILLDQVRVPLDARLGVDATNGASVCARSRACRVMRRSLWRDEEALCADR